MPEAQAKNAASDEPVTVTLKLDAKVYESFRQKAQKAGTELEPFLSSTLSIVLGCRVFNETHACSPQLSVVACPQVASKK